MFTIILSYSIRNVPKSPNTDEYGIHVCMIEQILKDIGLSENSQSIYVALMQYGNMAVKVISQKTGLPRTTVYDGLTPLVNQGLVLFKNEDGKSIYGIGDPNTLELLLDEQISSLAKTKQNVQNLVKSIQLKTNTLEPKIRFFSGNDGVKKILNDILWYKNTETYTVWPMHEMIRILGAEYLEWHNLRRVQRGIELKSIRVNEKPVDFRKFPYLSGEKRFLRKLRYAPSKIKIDMSYWIYGDKVAFVSTGTTIFGFIVHSQEFSNMMKLNFELLWDESKNEA